MTADIKIEDYAYALPDERIAKHPLAERDACKLINLHTDGTVTHHTFAQLDTLLPKDSLLIANNTRVINARLKFRKPTGAAIEIFLLEPIAPADHQLAFAQTAQCDWLALVGNSKRWKEGEITLQTSLSDGQTLTLTAHKLPSEDNRPEKNIRLSWKPAQLSLAEVIQAAGIIPIPPYLNRDTQNTDSQDYQTVYSRHQGSVAAPTAGLHFTPNLIERLQQAGIKTQYVTLHVGAGTFQPVKSETIGDHHMHTETFAVTASLLQSLIDAISANTPITAVGTTTVRTIESLPYIARNIRQGKPAHTLQWQPYEAEDTRYSLLGDLRFLLDHTLAQPDQTLHASTAIMIAPGFRWQITDRLITNFHQPQSTLLLLIDSFIDQNQAPEKRTWQTLYNQALSNDYRFLSYGDACLLQHNLPSK